jgi:hypothetical protein
MFDGSMTCDCPFWIGWPGLITGSDNRVCQLGSFLVFTQFAVAECSHGDLEHHIAITTICSAGYPRRPMNDTKRRTSGTPMRSVAACARASISAS